MDTDHFDLLSTRGGFERGGWLRSGLRKRTRQGKLAVMQRVPQRRLCSAFICLAIALSALLPMPQHLPAFHEVLEQIELRIAEHGHSHGLAEDLDAALHGHGHEAVEHEHGTAIPASAPSPPVPPSPGKQTTSSQLAVTPGIPDGILRPPRA